MFTVQNRPSIQHGGRGNTPFASLPSSFEPVIEPEAYHLHQTSPPQPESVYMHPTAVYSGSSKARRTPGMYKVTALRTV